MLHYYWPILTVILIVVFTMIFTLFWLKKPNASAENSGAKPRQNFADLYNRIHNYQNNNPSKATSPAPTPHNNTSTDSTYHHAIKLVQRGIDTKTLVEYCNLTQGEAELLQVIYGAG